MKSPLLIVLAAVVLVITGSAMALMNNACKSSKHAWCAPVSEMPLSVVVGRLCSGRYAAMQPVRLRIAGPVVRLGFGCAQSLRHPCLTHMT